MRTPTMNSKKFLIIAPFTLLLSLILIFTTSCSTVKPFHKEDRATEQAVVEEEPGSVPIVAEEDVAPEDLLSPQQTVEQASIWVIQADTLLVKGDYVNAEETLTLAITAVSSVLFEFDPIDRRTWVDSLAVWAQRYTESFARPGQVVGPGDEGLSALDAEILSDTLTSMPDTLLAKLPLDSLQKILAPDSIVVELDTLVVLDLAKLPDIPDTMNNMIQGQINYFTTTERGRKAMTVWLERAEVMIPRLSRLLRKYNMPEDLVYLSMIESGFRTDARSYARAVGPWQFIYSTAKIFDMTADWWYDERRDPEMATVAAAKYLRQLYEHTGDWYLAMAGYNCGEGRINREIRRSKSRDFWKLRRLPRQTRGYIPTYLAARKIAKNPEQYGFTSPTLKKPAPRDSVIITECVDISALANALEIEEKTLKLMNPAIIRWCTPPTRDTTVVYLPYGKSEGFADKYATIPDEEKTSWARHKVRTGETLSVIAGKYRTSTRAIMDVPANRLRNPHKISAGQYLLIPVAPSGSSYQYAHVRDNSEPDIPSGMEKRVHRVRRGETLSEIAEMYHVGLSKLLRWNNKSKRSIIRVGEKLTVYQPEGSPKPTQVASKSSGGSAGPYTSSGNYTVRRGDSPWSIASKHHITLSQLLAANNLSANTKIHPGDVLVIPGNGTTTSAEAVYHVVRRGDTLWEIAERYRVSVGDLKKWNKIRDSRRLAVGDKLVVYPSGGAS